MLKTNPKDQVKHLVYRITSIHDIIHPFSPEKYEILSDSFISFMNLECSDMQGDIPIMLEITGLNLSSEQKETISRAIWVHYRLHIVKTHNTLKHCRMKMIWFILCTFLSSFLLLLVTNETLNLMVQYIYLPFWFFGYRTLTFPFFEYYPTWKLQYYYRRLASMKLIYTKEPLNDISESLRRAVLKETSLNHSHVMRDITNNVLYNYYFMDQDEFTLECSVCDDIPLIRKTSLFGRELISEELEAYLSQAECFMESKVSMKMIISGHIFSDKEQNQIKTGLRRYYTLRYQDASRILQDTQKRILLYFLCLIVSSIILYFIDGSADIAYRELVVMVFWFFGDYLVEFLLLDLKEEESMVSVYKKLSDIPLIFKK